MYVHLLEILCNTYALDRDYYVYTFRLCTDIVCTWLPLSSLSANCCFINFSTQSCSMLDTPAYIRQLCSFTSACVRKNIPTWRWGRRVTVNWKIKAKLDAKQSNIKWIIYSPEHWRLLGSGNQFPFTHVEIVGPLSISPEGQTNVTVLSSSAGSMKSRTCTTSLTRSCGFPQVATCIVINFGDNFSKHTNTWNI
jgi:hypothetical protein